jgi:hypothetical protein
VDVDIECSLVYACGQSGIKALGESFGDGESVWYDRIRRRCLKDLQNNETVTSLTHRRVITETDLEQSREKGDDIRPLADILERRQDTFYVCLVFAILGIACKQELLGRIGR